MNFRNTRMKCYWLICAYCSPLNLVVHTCTSYRQKKGSSDYSKFCGSLQDHLSHRPQGFFWLVTHIPQLFTGKCIVFYRCRWSDILVSCDILYFHQIWVIPCWFSRNCWQWNRAFRTSDIHSSTSWTLLKGKVLGRLGNEWIQLKWIWKNREWACELDCEQGVSLWVDCEQEVSMWVGLWTGSELVSCIVNMEWACELDCEREWACELDCEQGVSLWVGLWTGSELVSSIVIREWACELDCSASK
jgi:hypothetical protein